MFEKAKGNRMTLTGKYFFKCNRPIINNQEVTALKSVANEFNKFLQQFSQSFFLSQVTNIKVIDIVITTNSNRASGP